MCDTNACSIQISSNKLSFLFCFCYQLVITMVVYVVVWMEKKWGLMYSPTSSPTTHHAGFPGQEEGKLQSL